MRLKLIILCLAALSFSACNSSSSSDDRIRNPSKQSKGCVDESDLMSPSGIVGGSRVYDGDADAQKVVLILSSIDEEKTAICTGSLIASDVLLTAAHCIEAPAYKTYVVTHSSVSCESGYNASQHLKEVSEVLAHPDYDKLAVKAGDSQNDVALIFLKNPIYGYPIYRLAKPTDVNLNLPLFFYGYGAVGWEKGGSGILRKTQIPGGRYELEEANGKVKVEQSYGTGICSGDSGGPGLVSVNGELQILGVNSYVMGDRSTDVCQGTSYLALADKYRSWISEKMRLRGRYLKP